MALNNVNASFTSFKKNDSESLLRNCIGPYSTSNVLDGGNTLDTTLLYTFTLTGLNGVKIQKVTFSALLLNSGGDLESARDYTLVAYKNDSQIGNSITATLPGSSTVRTTIPIQFYTSSQEEEGATTRIQLQVNSTNFNCYFAITYLSIQFFGYSQEIRVVFDGPATSRSANSIICAKHLLNKNAVDVSFSKNDSINFDPSNDTTEGRIYFRQDGIFVDGTQYGTVTRASTTKQGVVIIQDTFQIEDGGIVAPTGVGVAASPQLVYNALATAKNYTDEQTNYSDDFERSQEDNKLYIKWIEIS